MSAQQVKPHAAEVARRWHKHSGGWGGGGGSGGDSSRSSSKQPRCLSAGQRSPAPTAARGGWLVPPRLDTQLAPSIHAQCTLFFTHCCPTRSTISSSSSAPSNASVCTIVPAGRERLGTSGMLRCSSDLEPHLSKAFQAATCTHKPQSTHCKAACSPQAAHPSHPPVTPLARSPFRQIKPSLQPNCSHIAAHL